ncbi:MAG: CTP-dependent riboflavin kinase, partial [Clostridia bacterium]
VDIVNKIFQEKYGMILFLGTLNIQLDKEIVLDDDEKILSNEYGGNFDVLVKECKIFDNKGYILRTEKNNSKNGAHPLNIIEIVSDVNLRKIYELKDEDNCTVYIENL